jgi:transcriptional regulator with XRE-family HTH domain
MSFSSLGLEIKLLRKNRGFSQKELSRGICSQAQISKIEKGAVYPLAPTLYELSSRLGVDINYFFERALFERLDYVEEVYSQIREAINDYDYLKVEEIIKIERKNPIYNKNLEFKQFIMWHQGICKYHNDNEIEEALSLIVHAFRLTHTEKYYSEREIEILNSKGIIHLNNEENLEAIELYKELIDQHEKLKIEKDKTIKIRLYYNLAKALNKSNHHDRSIEVCEKGIKYCVENNNMYLFGHLYFQIGFNYYQMDLIEKSRLYFNKSYTIFDLQNNKNLKNHVKTNFLEKSK